MTNKEKDSRIVPNQVVERKIEFTPDYMEHTTVIAEYRQMSVQSDAGNLWTDYSLDGKTWTQGRNIYQQDILKEHINYRFMKIVAEEPTTVTMLLRY